MKRISALLLLVCLTTLTMAQRVSIQTGKKASAREQYAAEYLQKKLTEMGYTVSPKTGDCKITLSNANSGAAEGYTIARDKKGITVTGNDATGVIYGCVELADRIRQAGGLAQYVAMPSQHTIQEAPQMVMRGTCIGLQKTVYLPGHGVYEYPYTPENFPWFYDKAEWPFASLVKLKDYPFALEVDEETFKKNEEIFSFLTHEADKRGIWVIQMFYNIILSKPFADHYGLKTQDRHRPITPLISDYTRKSIAAFIEKYPNVGLLVCLGEAMATIDDDVKWMKETIIPGIKDGLKTSGRTDIPPVVLRSHDTDGPLVLKESLPLYPNIYTMSKYTGESLTTYTPGGPWGETHQQLAAAAPVHIDNVHILANLEPWRWSSPAFIQKTVQAMHRVHHSKGLHLYPQASYWDWPYTADKLPNGERLKQLDRETFWKKTLADYYGIDTISAGHVLNAYDEAGEIAPKLLRRFGITEGNRQTLLLGMTMGELVNSYKYTIYPGFYESCGPEGEKLIEYIEKEYKGQPHVGELPFDIVDQCVNHGDRALVEMGAAAAKPTRHAEEYQRVWNDMLCYASFAKAFQLKVRAAAEVLRYKWTQDISHLETAVIWLEQSLSIWYDLSRMTDDWYLYMKTWSELAVVYQAELDAFKENIEKLKNPAPASAVKIAAAQPAKVTILSPLPAHLLPLKKGAILFEKRPDTPVDSLAPELVGLQALVLNRDTTRIVGTTIEYDSDFKDDDKKFAKAPKLEIDATGNEYGQAEPILTNAISIVQMPKVNIHQYSLPAGRNTIRLPKGILMVAGFTQSDIKPRDCGLNGPSGEVDWLFQK